MKQVTALLSPAFSLLYVFDLLSRHMLRISV